MAKENTWIEIRRMRKRRNEYLEIVNEEKKKGEWENRTRKMGNRKMGKRGKEEKKIGKRRMRKTIKGKQKKKIGKRIKGRRKLVYRMCPCCKQ